jgi:lysophospholipase L1-like esterase
LKERLQRALDLVHPQLIVACYGMNDGIYHPQSPERMAAFQKGIQDLIAAVRGRTAELILLTPPPFDPVPLATTRPASAPDFSYMAPYEKYDDVLGEYAAWEKTLTAADVRVVDLHTAMDAYLAKQRATNPKFSFTKDGIHPDAAGHLLMARTILKDLKINVPQDPLDGEAARIQADPLYVIVKSYREKRSLAWLDYVGYTRDKTVKTQYPNPSEDTLKQIEFQIDLMRGAK